MSPKRPVLSAHEVIRALSRAGFSVVGQRGSHVRLKGIRGGRTCLVIVPRHAEITPGTFASILRQAAMAWDEFEPLL